MRVVALASALTLYNVVPVGKDPEAAVVTTCIRKGGANPPELRVKVPSEAVVVVLMFPLASLRVTLAPAIGAPKDAVPVTVFADEAPTVNGDALLACPPTLTIMLPVFAPLGTVTVMLVALHALAAPAEIPLNVTVEFPWFAPKFNPVIVSAEPATPEFALRLVITGATVNDSPLLACPPTLTMTIPVVAPLGTWIVMLVALQALAAPAEIPLNVTLLLPWLAPKFNPVIVSVAPAAPEFGPRVVIIGAAVNRAPLLATPDTVTTTLPVVAPVGTLTVMLVALHALAGPAEIPLNVMVLLPWLAPKFDPVIVTAAPTAPEDGLRLLIAGAGGAPLLLLLFPPLLLPPPPPQFNSADNEQKSSRKAKRRRGETAFLGCEITENCKTDISDLALSDGICASPLKSRPARRNLGEVPGKCRRYSWVNGDFADNLCRNPQGKSIFRSLITNEFVLNRQIFSVMNDLSTATER